MLITVGYYHSDAIKISCTLDGFSDNRYRVSGVIMAVDFLSM
jgi:hypothetical protein